MRCNKNMKLNSVNITLFFSNIKRYLTDKSKIIMLCLLILMLSFVNITIASALSYQTRTGVSFTFNPTLAISLSDNNLVIPSLVAGDSSDSNSINVLVDTNAIYGYTLSVNTNDEELTSDIGSNFIFSSLDPAASLADFSTADDNTWGYSYSINNSNNWSNYSGLSTSANKVLLNTDSNTSKPVNFKIAAKAAINQPSGVYSTTINFIAVTKPTPSTISDIVYMQTFGNLSTTDLASVKNSMVANQTYTLKDARDEQEYTVAKLDDNKIWMTKNLNLAGGTEITSELSDVPEGYTLPVENRFQEGNKLPADSKQFSDNTLAYVYKTGNDTDDCADGCYTYYSWIAATAGSGVGMATLNDDAPYSICPKGWRLPTSQRFSSTKGSDFYNLINIYTAQSNTFYSQAGPGTTANFLPGGIFSNLYFYYGNNTGDYWSSTIVDSTSAGALQFNSSSSGQSGSYYRRYGYSVRCLAR